MDKYVYHGSNKGDITEFIPKESTQKGKYIYATESFEVAAIFGFRMGSLERSLGFYKGKLEICERKKDYLKSVDCPVYIYKFDSKPFEYFDEDNWGNHEVRTPKSVKPLEVLKFDSAVKMLKQFASEGKLNLYFYPDKPGHIPQNDYDLIGTAARLYSMNTKNLNYIMSLTKSHPHFIAALNCVLNKIDNLPENEKRDYARTVYNNKTQTLLPEIQILVEGKCNAK